MNDKNGLDELHISYAVRYSHYVRNRKWRIAFRLSRSISQTLPFFLIGSLISTIAFNHNWIVPIVIASLEIVVVIVMLRLRRISMRLFPRLDHDILSY